MQTHLKKKLINHNYKNVNVSFSLSQISCTLEENQSLKDLYGLIRNLGYQIDKNSGYLRWAIHLYATGNTEWGWWNMPKFCNSLIDYKDFFSHLD